MQIPLQADLLSENQKMHVRLAAHEALIGTYLYRTNDDDSTLHAWRNS